MTTTNELVLPIGDLRLAGTLSLPDAPTGLVLFAHGSGSSRQSPRNRRVAAALQQHGLATLLFDLLTPEEEEIDLIDASLRFDIPLLADRLIGATDIVRVVDPLRELPIGYFGASTGAAAALVAAAKRSDAVSAVVSRGGRPDLAGAVLPSVRAPTLFIVGGDDRWVLGVNQQAARQMTAPHRVVVVEGATHLFEEPGALDHVARLAAAWFTEQLARNTACIGTEHASR
jgi:pimeloyl-ACP methyl ester carboxylesterase